MVAVREECVARDVLLGRISQVRKPKRAQSSSSSEEYRERNTRERQIQNVSCVCGLALVLEESVVGN